MLTYKLSLRVGIHLLSAERNLLNIPVHTQLYEAVVNPVSVSYILTRMLLAQFNIYSPTLNQAYRPLLNVMTRRSETKRADFVDMLGQL